MYPFTADIENTQEISKRADYIATSQDRKMMF
jgi:hypothetical protein